MIAPVETGSYLDLAFEDNLARLSQSIERIQRLFRLFKFKSLSNGRVKVVLINESRHFDPHFSTAGSELSLDFEMSAGELRNSWTGTHSSLH